MHYEWLDAPSPDTKDTIVFIHAVGLDMHSWDFIVPQLREHYNILRYDLRGHGQSTAGNRERTIDLLCEDLSNLLASLNVKQYHLIGQGIGGFLAIQLATQADERLQSLILIGSPIHYPKSLGKKIAAQRKALAQAGSIMPMAENLVTKICYPPTAEKTKILLDAYRKVPTNVYFDLFQPAQGAISVRNLQKVSVPILILSGAEDAIFPPELSSVSMIFNPNARYFTVPYASFMVQMDQPDITVAWIHDFIGKSKLQQKNIVSIDYQTRLTTEMYNEIKDMMENDTHAKPINQLKLDFMHCFGVYVNGEKILDGWNKRKAKELLAFLVLQASVTRDQLCDMFWPDADVKSARNRLRVSLHHLKKVLATSTSLSNEAPLLIMDREQVFLQGHIESDLLTYIESIKEAKREKNLEKKCNQFEQLLQEETDHLMPGFYDEWFLDLRNWIEQEWGEMAAFLVHLYGQQKDFSKVKHYSAIAVKYGTTNMEWNLTETEPEPSVIK
ncbi:alpha/beta fold hydrolase [Virgibacillus sp. FSP13]